MLQQQITRLKNVIAFKMTLCAFIVGFLFWYESVTQERLEYSTQQLGIASLELSGIESKVQLIKNSAALVEATYGAYSEALKNPFDLSCLAKDKFINDLSTVANQFHLRDQPKVDVSTRPSIEKFHNNEAVQIMTTDINVTFPAQGFAHAFGFIKGVYKILPEYTILKSIDIYANNIITPETINELSSTTELQLMDCELKLKIREIKVSPEVESAEQ